MTTLQKRFEGLSIARKFLLSLLLVSLLPLLIVTVGTHGMAERTLIEEQFNALDKIADLKALQINEFMRDREAHVEMLAHTPTIVEALKEFHRAFEYGSELEAYSTVESEYRAVLTYYQEAWDDYDLFLISPAGDIVFTVIHEDDFGTNLVTGPYSDSELARVFESASSSLETRLSDFKYYPASKEPAAFVASPVLEDGEFVGVLALQMSTAEIYAHVQDYTGLGETGETIVAIRDGERAVFIAPLRHDPEAAFNRSVLIGFPEALPIQNAVQERSGHGMSVDYRDKETLAVWRYLPHLRWGMVVKIDADEALASVFRLRLMSVAIGVVSILAVVFFSVFVARTVSRPIKALKAGTEIIGSGDLDHKVGTDAKDEVGVLSRAIDRMTESLKKITASRDDLNREIERRVRIERERERLFRETEMVNKELKDFAYIVSHDLKAPLRAISQLAHWVSQDYGERLDDEGREQLGMLERRTGRMYKMIDDILEYSKIGRVRVSPKKVDVGKVVKQTIDSLSPGPNVTVRLDGAFPEVTIDPVQIGQVFQNLIGNALKYMDKDEGLLEVGAVDRDGFWEFYVSDNGPGIEERHYERIFQIFQSLRSRDEAEGTGVGLTIVKKIVELNGGTVSVESKVGRGSTFRFTLPVEPLSGGGDGE